MAQKNIGIGVEATWGTKIAPTTFLEASAEALRLEKLTLPVTTIRSVPVRRLALLGDIVRGTFRGPCNYQEVSALLFMMFGDKTTSAAGALFTHRIPASSPAWIRPGVTIEVQRDPDESFGETWKYLGCIFTELGFAFGIDQLAEYTASVVGKSELREAGVGSPSYKTFDLVLPTECVATIDGASVDCSAWNATISWPVDEPRKLGALGLARKPKDSDVLTVKGSFTLLNHVAIQYAKFSGDTDVSLVLDAQASGAAEEFFKIFIPTAKLTQATPQIDGRTVPMPTYEFEGTYNAGALTSVYTETNNDQSGASVP